MKNFKIGQKVVRIEDYGPGVSRVLKNDICVINYVMNLNHIPEQELTVTIIKSPEPARIGIVDTIYSKFFKHYKQKIIKRKPNGTKL